jgi:NAD(P)-dependent dehydrogenase (short-subunit alcohol dehydrogenase family)
VGEGCLEPVGHFGVVRDERQICRNGGEHGRDVIACNSVIGLELGDRVDFRRVERKLFPRLAQRRLGRRLSGIDAPAGKGDLTSVSAQVVSPHGQNDTRFRALGNRDQDRRVAVRPIAAFGDVARQELRRRLKHSAELIGQSHHRQLSSLARRRNDDAMSEARTAIVTGAGKRVGLEIAKALLADGWTVISHVHHESSDVAGGTVKAVADLSEPDCADRIIAAAGGLPPVRLLVNNASRFSWDGFGDFKPDEFDAHMAINVRTPLLLTEAFGRAHRGGDGLIVNLLDSKLAAPNPDFLSYTLSKQALAGLTELSARALAPKGIRVNGIAPALMLPSAGQSQANYERMHSANPLRRGVETTHVVQALRYLIAVPTITGEVLQVDGGQRFSSFPRDVQFLEEE